MTIDQDWLRSSYAYELDPSRIAQSPVDPRDESRLFVYDRGTERKTHVRFRDIEQYLRKGDLLVVNTTRVLPARLKPRRQDTGSEAEVLLLHQRSASEWEALVKPGKRLHPGIHLTFDDETTVEIAERLPEGRRLVRFSRPIDLCWLESVGSMPLPPYIHRQATSLDTESYQTVYANEPGAVAAPTAGLHFTPELLARLDESGVHRATVLLHVGIGTFRPVRVDDVRTHPMDAEYYEVSAETLRQIRETKRRGGRVIAVGTTSVRTLETLARTGELTSDRDVSGWTRLFLYPPHQMQVVDAIITNFHLPESTLLMLVAAFTGRERTLELYRDAIDLGYRFYSYGDAMLIL